MLHLDQLFVGVFDKVLDDVLFAQPVTACDGIVKMRLEAVMGLRDRCRATLSRHSVAAHGINLGDQRNRQRRIRLGGCNRRPETATATSDNYYVSLERIHQRTITSC